MSFQENLEILATKDERMEYLKGIVLASQMHEKPLELSDLQAKLDGLEGEAWSRELLRSLHASEYKASWKKFKEDKDIKDIPKPFIGRLDDIGQDGSELIATIADMFTIHGIETEIIAASIRHPQHIQAAALAGAHIATTPFKVLQQLFKHPLTDKGIEGFLADWAKREGK